MVHALKQTHNVLREGGLLVNILDLPTPQVIEVHIREEKTRVGWLQDKDDFENTRSALNALALVVSDHDFMLEDEQDFPYNIYIDSLPELQKWLEEWWETAILTEEIFQRLQELTKAVHQPAKIVLALRARMTILRAV